ncbi:MAG: RDD family protein [Flavobacteriaceae bacterium]|uniref:RDD family protein n=1 Tax=Nonlabens ulvanivorans TaxID=906888 RepID=UPI003299A5AC
MIVVKTEANIGLRILACLIDYLIIYGFTFTLIFTIGVSDGNGTYSLKGFPAFVPVLFWLFMTVILESAFGATIGNSIAGLKAIPMSGRNINLSFTQSLKRHLLDPLDMFFFGLVAIITINNTEKNQRVGDLWADTIVVKTKDLKN